jgi:cupin superfamily acireductone dioxygenase involved in methionine salvage
MEMLVLNKFKKAHHQKNSADAVSTEQWKFTKLPNLLKKFCSDDIYNADEIRLFYCGKL